MRFRLEDSRTGPDQDLIFSRGGNTSSAVGMTWAQLLSLRNFLDTKLAAREIEMRAARESRRSSMSDVGNVSLHILED